MQNVFDNAIFIKPNVKLDKEFSLKNYAPMFRKKVTLDKTGNARLYVCGLGYGYYYINGVSVSPDLFTAPVSDYRKTLWYNTYDVSSLLREGENTIAVILGNGWFNETFKTTWQISDFQQRDVPKFILRLETDGKTALVTDHTWKCCPESATYFNQLRSGEFFDANLYDSAWNTPEYDDSEWGIAIRDSYSPSGVFRECKCEPIREHECYAPKKVYKTGEQKYVFDLGQNIAGYVRITTTGQKGDTLIICHTEDINPDLTLNYNDLFNHIEDGVPVQQDRLTLSGEKITWSPKFTYHGFRYVEVDGIRDISDFEICGVFVHQALKKKTDFECSNKDINTLFDMGVKASYSNMYYILSDCPTREKLGWMNDLAASAEQMLTTFDSSRFFEKILRDIYDAMFSDGSLPCIVPSFGWGLVEWIEPGLACDHSLFELPYRIYLHTGNKELFTAALPYFKRYLSYIQTRKNDEQLIDIGLWDWVAPGSVKLVERTFINAVLEYCFCDITHLCAKTAGDESEEYYRSLKENHKRFIIDKYVDENGRCIINEQAPLAMLIYYGLYDDLAPLKEQLVQTLLKTDMHNTCGMVALRRLYYALDKCGLSQYSYDVINADGYPCYKEWIKNDATTLCEFWENKDSKNHHMYSDFMSWLVKRLGGISLDESKIGELEYVIDPKFVTGIDYVKCSTDGISVFWQREDGKVKLNLKINENVKVSYNGAPLSCGEYNFVI